jgi:hypothetical protein
MRFEVLIDKRRSSGMPNSEQTQMGLLTFSLNVTLDGCVDHQEGIADDETHAFFTHLMDEGGAMLWGRVTYEMMEGYWPAVARGDEDATPAIREWAVKLEAKPKYVVSSTRTDFPWNNSHQIAGDLRTGELEAKPKYVVSSTRTDLPWTNSHHIAGDLRAGVQKIKK